MRWIDASSPASERSRFRGPSDVTKTDTAIHDEGYQACSLIEVLLQDAHPFTKGIVAEIEKLLKRFSKGTDNIVHVMIREV
jgi:hypothetical protein